MAVDGNLAAMEIAQSLLERVRTEYSRSADLKAAVDLAVSGFGVPHEIDGFRVRLRLPSGAWGDWIDLGLGLMRAAVYDTDADGKVDAAEAADSAPWGGITGKPGAFPPAAHGHAIADVAGLPAALDRIRVGETRVAVDTAEVNPDAADIGDKIQAMIDAYPGRTIVIPPFAGGALKSRTTCFIDRPGSIVENHARIVRPAGVYLQDGIFAVRKRAAGGAKLTDVGLRSYGSYFFEAVQTASFAATAGQTVFAVASPATTKFDFHVVRIRAGAWKVLSASSDIVAGGPTGFTLASGALAGDEYRVAIVAASARSGVCPVEGTTTDPVGRVIFEGTLVADGLYYVLNQVAYCDDFRCGDVIAYGGVDRSTIYPYLAGGEISTGHLKADGIPREGWGANFGPAGNGIPLCYYGLNINVTGTWSRIRVGGLTTVNLTAHGAGVLGDVRRLLIEGHTSENPGAYHAVMFQGASGQEDVQILGFDYDGVTAGESIYVLGDNVRLTEGVVRNATGPVRFNSTGGRRKGNRLQVEIIDPTVSNALFIQEQDDIRLDVAIRGGPAGATTSANLFNVARPKGRIAVEHTSNAGDAVLAYGVTDGLLDVAATGKSRALLLYGNATDNTIRLQGRGNSSIGVQLLTGSDNNVLAGTVRGNTFPLLDGAAGSNTTGLKQ